MSAKLAIAIATTLLSWISAGCMIHCFWHFFRNPASFNSGRFVSRKLGFAYISLVMLGLGYCIFCGVEATVGWIPRTWVAYSDDGDDPIWVGYTIAFIVAFFGAQVLFHEMAKLAQRVVDGERRMAK